MALGYLRPVEDDVWIHPQDAIIEIDFLGGTPQGRAWVDGAGEVAIDTLLGTDANTIPGWSASEYDPARLTADGYVQLAGHPCAFIGAARSKILDAVTMRFALEQVVSSDPALTYLLAAMSADGNDAAMIQINSSTAVLSGGSYNGAVDISVENVVNVGLGASNVAAVTFTGTRIEAACNGCGADTDVLDSTIRPPGNPFVAALIDTGAFATPGQAIQSIVLYDPLTSTAGLPELSYPVAWTDQGGGTADLYQALDESAGDDDDYIQSPEIPGFTADLKVRLLEGGTQIVEWSHFDIADTFSEAEQVLTTEQYAAIGDFGELRIEFDDNAGHVYGVLLSAPAVAVAEPVSIRYRYKKVAGG